MTKIDEFKNFISNYTKAIEMVKNNETTWQELYELYDIYGTNSDAWDKYFNSSKLNLKGILNTLKNINIDSLEENINSIQKTINLVEEFTKEDKIEDKVKSKSQVVDTIYKE